MNENYRKALAIEKQNKEKLSRLYPFLTEVSGIYMLTRIDEIGIKYAYVGQAKKILTRMAQHLAGYQHIDLSLKKHGFYSKENQYGWTVSVHHCEEHLLDTMEKTYIKAYANQGYQLRNKTAGGQGEGKVQIDEYRPNKTYRDGIYYGKKALAKELKNIIDKHLTIELKDDKKGNKTSEKALGKFYLLLGIEKE